MDSREPAQAVWSGSIVFGLVVLPVKLYAATSKKAVQFRRTHAADGGRIRLRRVCELDGEEVPDFSLLGTANCTYGYCRCVNCDPAHGGP
ncbi:Ku protein [Streptomyces hirsutus]|uniref:Ku protein n=1 Tax=Streptomyces hirsutus TaxID=35620 RepID=UPI0036A54FA4